LIFSHFSYFLNSIGSFKSNKFFNIHMGNQLAIIITNTFSRKSIFYVAISKKLLKNKILPAYSGIHITIYKIIFWIIFMNSFYTDDFNSKLYFLYHKHIVATISNTGYPFIWVKFNIFSCLGFLGRTKSTNTY
jgi:hypothetical protein